MIEPHNDITRFIEHTVAEIKEKFITVENIEFCRINVPDCDIYLVYETKIRYYLSRLSSYEMKEKGIIYKKNEDYFYFSFNEKYEDKEEIIKKFVENVNL
ncbi:MAG: hypothetical protein Q4P18_03115 [Methanobrevibacter sp.]|uniref:hypothetical protein n=1 Tax=Methanobrevibacter sp. TaxID=66852 RepID=UPI0026E0295A|nr:hypothetical protein [Methanobrevibacter sp.]MDO5848502.1 hypothetical protein [Methanobrevibacter sp.]